MFQKYTVYQFSALILISGLLFSSSLFGQTTENIKVMTYNLLQYGVTSGPGCTPATVASKNTWLQLITSYYQPDLFAVNELRWNTNHAYALNIKSNALTYNPAMQITDASNNAGSEIANMLFYNSAKFGYLNHTAITGNVRDIDIYKLYHKNSTSSGDSTLLWVMVAHLKAGNTAGDAADRGDAAADVMSWLSAHTEVTNCIIMGDFNLYSSNEAAYVALTNPSHPKRFYDPSGVTTGWSGASFAAVHTQCPTTSQTFCASGGGMDDRFDFILAGHSIMNHTQKIAFKTGSYKAFGNDGTSYNTDLNCTNALPSTVCSAVKQISDHIPVVMELQIDVTTGIHQASLEKELTITPQGNPFRETLSLGLHFNENAQSQYFLQILNPLGEIMETRSLVVKEPFLSLEMDTQNWAEGLYFIQISDAKGRSIAEKCMKW